MRNLIEKLQSIAEARRRKLPPVQKLPASEKNVSLSARPRGGQPAGKMISMRWVVKLAKVIDARIGAKLPWKKKTSGKTDEMEAVTSKANVTITAYRKSIYIRVALSDGTMYQADGHVKSKWDDLDEKNVYILGIMNDVDQLLDGEKPGGKKFPINELKRAFQFWKK